MSDFYGAISMWCAAGAIVLAIVAAIILGFYGKD